MSKAGAQTFTPGPWRVGPFHNSGSYAIHAQKCSVIHAMPFFSSAGSAEANARLIAASPDLLAALKAVYEAPNTTDSNGQVVVRLYAEDFHAIKKAVEKAEEGL